MFFLNFIYNKINFKIINPKKNNELNIIYILLLIQFKLKLKLYPNNNKK
jgi:hypothetical protein